MGFLLFAGIIIAGYGVISLASPELLHRAALWWDHLFLQASDAAELHRRPIGLVCLLVAVVLFISAYRLRQVSIGAMFRLFFCP
ncbi:MAG: hypothetical protein HYV08_06595 [Deltaproteobacteria bacterium]|nr:hypothetical protein [Deltaproteobacteria bacterium]MBI3077403.1 hypothetical protein [Deltaproteobacteria bacterium]